jgi:hypothetical protein
MVERAVSLIHIGLTALLLAALAGIFRASDAAPPSVYHTYHLCALAGVGFAGYYLFYQLVVSLAPPQWGVRRARPDHLSPYYTDASEEPAGADLVVGRPRLTMESVWVVVYGLGMAFAVLAYCFSGQHLVSFYFLAVGLCVCVLYEALEPGPAPQPGLTQAILQVMAMILASTAILIANVQGHAQKTVVQEFVEMDLFSVVCGVLFPALAPLLLANIRVSTFPYKLGSVLELCEFGVPFLLIIVASFLAVGDGPNIVIGRGWVERPIQAIMGHANATRRAAFTTSRDGFWLLFLLAPLPFAALVVIVVAAVVRGHAADPLTGIALFVAGAGLAAPRDVPTSLVTLLLAVGALGCRCVNREGKKEEGDPQQGGMIGVGDRTPQSV